MRLLIHHCMLNSYLFAFSAPVIAFYSTVHNWICRLTIMYIYSDYFASSFSYFLQCAWKFCSEWTIDSLLKLFLFLLYFINFYFAFTATTQVIVIRLPTIWACSEPSPLERAHGAHTQKGRYPFEEHLPFTHLIKSW